MIENGFFILGGPETQLHDILWAVHDGKIRGISEGEENIGEFLGMVAGQGLSDARFSCTRTRVGARRWALTEPDRARNSPTEPERLHCRLRVTKPERSIDPLLLTEPE